MSACGFCNTPLTRTFVDLGHTPLANSYLSRHQLDLPETHHPLHVKVCERCLLVQLDHKVDPEDIFRQYDYFSSTSPTWVENARRKAESLIRRFQLGPASLVAEIGSNDGYLLRHFKDHGVQVMGIDPAANCAVEAERAGVPTLVRFFGEALGRELKDTARQADLITGTNTLAHIPRIRDCLKGLASAVKPRGVVAMEFPHILNLIRHTQFDTIYHEHYYYFSLHALAGMFEDCGLSVFDVEEIPTHGGSLCVYAQPSGAGRETGPRVDYVLDKEVAAGLNTLDGYDGFAGKVWWAKIKLLEFLVKSARDGFRVAAYGAPAKGSTLLNHCGVGRDLIEFVVDDSPHKQGKFMPGSHIPIISREHLIQEQPPFTIILPWNLEAAIRERNTDYSGRWVVPIPNVKVF